MAMTGVLRPGHIQIRVLDLEVSRKFYRDVIGLVDMGTDNQGRVYFKAWDERDHNSVVLRQADSAGVDFVGYKVLNKSTLDQLERDVQAFGIPTSRMPAGDMLETGSAFVSSCPRAISSNCMRKKSMSVTDWGRSTHPHGVQMQTVEWPLPVLTTACSTDRTSPRTRGCSLRCWASSWSNGCLVPKKLANRKLQFSSRARTGHMTSLLSSIQSPANCTTFRFGCPLGSACSALATSWA